MYYLLYMVAFYHTIYTHNVLFFGLKQKSWIFSTFLHFEYLFRSNSSERQEPRHGHCQPGMHKPPHQLRRAGRRRLRNCRQNFHGFRVKHRLKSFSSWKKQMVKKQLPPDVRFPARNSSFVCWGNGGLSVGNVAINLESVLVIPVGIHQLIERRSLPHSPNMDVSKNRGTPK